MGEAGVGAVSSVQYQGTNAYPLRQTPNDVYVGRFSYTSAGLVAGKRFEGTRQVLNPSTNRCVPATIELVPSQRGTAVRSAAFSRGTISWGRLGRTETIG